jgi:hypothetical protein
VRCLKEDNYNEPHFDKIIKDDALSHEAVSAFGSLFWPYPVIFISLRPK